MRTQPRPRAAWALVALLVLATLILAPVAAAHAELTGSDPANGATVTGPLAAPVVLTFSEALQAGSRAELLDAAGTKLADAAIDQANPARMTFTLASPLGAGGYRVQWTSVAADRDVHRGQVSFTVVEPTPPPATPTPVPTATVEPTSRPSVAPSAAPTASPIPSASPVASPTPVPGEASATDVMIPIVAALALVGIVAYVLLRRGRAAP